MNKKQPYFYKYPFLSIFYVLILVLIPVQSVLAENGVKDVVISGKTLPAIEVIATIDNQKEVKATSNKNGEFHLKVKDIAQGIHSLTLFSMNKQGRKSNIIQTSFSIPVSDPPGAISQIEVGGFELLFQNQDCSSNPDLNHDNKINLVDFSILIYRWNSNDCEADLNGDGKVDLADFNILLGIWSKFNDLLRS